MGNKLVSIVVPIYQVKDYLNACIESILRQTYRNIEVILVDDGSTDGCAEICDEYKLKDDRVIVIHKKNGGIVSARKSGVNAANGDYLCYVDGDDWIEEDYINNYMIYANADDKLDMVWSLVFQKEYKSGTMICGLSTPDEELLISDTYQKKLYKYVIGELGFQYEIAYSLCTVCFKKSLIKLIQNQVDDKIVHDEDFFCMIRCIMETSSIRFIHNEGYHYVQREDSVVRRVYSFEDNKEAIEEIIQLINSKEERDCIKLLVQKKYYMEQLYHGNISCLQNDNSDIVIPYRNAKKSKNIILYGMGNAGKYLLNYFAKSKVCNVIGYIDRLENCISNNLKQYKIEELNNIKFDYILITTVKKSYVDEIRKKLNDCDIMDSKIAFVDDKLLDDLILLRE